MSLNPNAEIRCRNILAPYYDQRIEFVGFLKNNLANYVTSHADKSIKTKNALFIDVHAYQTICDNPDKEKRIDFEIDHIHCRLKNQEFDKYNYQMLTFTAKVYRYQAYYKHTPEFRYGLTDLMVKTNDRNANHSLNQKFKTKLTQSQMILLQTITKHLPNKYPNLALHSFNYLTNQLYDFKTLNDRTSFLVYTADTVKERHQLSDNKLEFFMYNEPTQSISKQMNDYREIIDNKEQQLEHQRTSLAEAHVQNQSDQKTIKDLTRKIELLKKDTWKQKYLKQLERTQAMKERYDEEINTYQDVIDEQTSELKSYEDKQVKPAKTKAKYVTPSELASKEQLEALRDLLNH